MATSSFIASFIAPAISGLSLGTVSVQDVRDFFAQIDTDSAAVAVIGVLPYGEIYLTAAVETSVAAVDTPIKAAGTTIITGNFTSIYFDQPAVGRLRYTGTQTEVFFVEGTFSMTAAANNKVFDFHLYKNGSLIPGSTVSRKIATGADVGSAAISTGVELEEDDYVELWVENKTDDTNITLTHLNLFANGLPEAP